jgi:hypothetical protein
MGRPVSDEAEAVFAARLRKATKLARAAREQVTPSLTSTDIAHLRMTGNTEALEMIEFLAQTRTKSAPNQPASEATWDLAQAFLAFADEGATVEIASRLDRALANVPSRRR